MKIVQLGTNTGNDHVRDLCLQVKPQLVILVEPFVRHNSDIQINYKDIQNVYIENIAIVTGDTKEIVMYYTELDGKQRGPECSYLVTSILQSHLEKHGYQKESMETFITKAMRINELFDKYNLSTIDFLFIDIEGIDFDVLKMIDFEKYKIQNLQIEQIHLNLGELSAFMSQKGYEPHNGIDSHGYDVMFRLRHI
jgi:FkbM family methyltransferase